jgi:hypothetical protein
MGFAANCPGAPLGGTRLALLGGSAGVFPDGRQMKFADRLWFIAVIVALFSPAIVGILHHT